MTNPTPPHAEIKVTDADRAAANALMVELFQGSPDLEADLAWAKTVIRGEDDEYPIVQAFAAHAEAARIEEREDCALVADALADEWRLVVGLRGHVIGASSAARAILARGEA